VDFGRLPNRRMIRSANCLVRSFRSFSSFIILISHFTHAAGAAGGVVDAAFVGGEHLDEAAHDAGRGVELAAVLALGAGEAGEEILMSAAALTLRAACGSLCRSGPIVNAAEQIDGAVGLLALAGGGEFDGGDDVDEFAEALVILRYAQALRCGFAWGAGAVAPGSVEAGAGVVLGQDAFEARVVTLDGDHGVWPSLK